MYKALSTNTINNQTIMKIVALFDLKDSVYKVQITNNVSIELRNSTKDVKIVVEYLSNE